jgi:hypothetical protein
MLFPVIVVTVIVALFAVVVYATDRVPKDLGWMSDRWLAEYRASRAP